jgi:hypothetical protein
MSSFFETSELESKFAFLIQGIEKISIYDGFNLSFELKN